MDILYLISYAGQAGTEKYVLDLMTAFSAAGHRCHLAYDVRGPLAERAEERGFPVIRLDLRPSRVPAAGRELAAYCRDRGIGVIHAQYPRENVIALAAKRRLPGLRVIFTSHLTIRQGPAWRLANRMLTPRDDAVVAVCTRGAETLRENGVCPERIHVIFNGLEPAPLPPRQNVLRRELGLGEETFVFFTAARYAPEKGLGFLLDALSELRRRTDRPFACAIAGEGEEFAAVKRRIGERGLEDRVFPLGQRQDVPALLASADAYVSSALYNEAMSFAVLEAMSAGLPLAVTDVGAGRDLSRGCGFVCPPGDTEAMADQLRKLAEDPELCRRLGREAHRRAVTEFDIRQSRRRLLELYGEQ